MRGGDIAPMRENEERAEVATTLRRVAGSVVLLGEAYGRRLRLYPRARALVERAAGCAGAACVDLAAWARRGPPSRHAHVEAQLLSVYGPDVEIPPLAWEMAMHVERQDRR